MAVFRFSGFMFVVGVPIERFSREMTRLAEDGGHISAAIVQEDLKGVAMGLT